MATKQANVTAEARSALGSRANKRLRDTGKLPGVIYGHKQAVIPITLTKKEVVGHLDHGAHLFALNLAGKSENVLVKEVQYDHLGLEVIHVDFSRVDLTERVQVTIPLELKGTPKGEADGGVLQQSVIELKIECVVTDIPDAIRFNVSDMGMDSVLHIKDLPFPPGVKSMQDEDLIVAQVREILEAAPTEAVEGTTAEPEVIGTKKAEGEEAAPAAGGAAPAAKPAAEKK
jgi:large subunit ribosomal protein L25